MTPDHQTEIGILIAAMGGLAVGLEREWSGHASGPSARFAGVRTFTLMGILSGMAGWLSSNQSPALAAILIAGAVGLVIAAYVAGSRQQVDGTTEVASLVVIAAGLAAGLGFWAMAGGIFAITTLLLVEKSRIHELASQLDNTSLRAAVRFGVMAIVILPLLPEGPYGPGPGFRPRTLWLAVLIFSGLSFAGYIARKLIRGSMGYPVTGMLGGVMSSTSVTLAFSRMSRAEKGHDGPLAIGVIGASTVLFVRVLVATATLNAPLARAAAPYFALPFLAGVGAVAFSWYRTKRITAEEAPVRNPLQFWNSLQMAMLFQVVFYLVHWVREVFGNQGLLASGAILGFADVDALTLSMARGVEFSDWTIPAQALSIGILSNTVLKVVIALVLGSSSFRRSATIGLAAIGVALLISMAILR